MNEKPQSGCLRKGCVLPVASIALLIAIFLGREVYLALTAKPGSAVDYHALVEELVASHQPDGDENGWELLREALDRKQAFEGQSEWADAFDHAYSFARDPAGWDEEGEEFTNEQLREAADTGLAGLRDEGVWDLLEQLAESPRVIRPLAKQGNLLDVLLPELGQTRSLARALGARMRVSHDAGTIEGDADVAAAVVQGAGLARALMHQFTLIDNLVGIAIGALFQNELRHELVERPMDEQSLATIAAALEQLATLPPELPFQGERLFMLDTIQWTHTDNGRGNGRFILSNAQTIGSFSPGAPSTGSSWVNLGSIAFPSKKQTTEQAEFFYGKVIEVAQTPRNERHKLDFDADRWLSQLSVRQMLIRIMVPALEEALKARDLFDAMNAGTRTMVAIERFKLREGTYPESLDQLVPDFLPSLPVDPFAKDGKFIYRTIDTTADEWSRPYTLYSVGADETDDAGVIHPKEAIKAFRENESGSDFVFNMPRPTPDDK